MRERRLWPVALVLVAAVVAVPVLLARHPKPASPPRVPLAGLPASSVNAVPQVTLQTTPIRSALSARGHDPFAQQKLAAVIAKSKSSSSSSSTSTPSTSSTTPASPGSTNGTGAPPATTTTGAPPTTPPPTVVPAITPTPIGLTATQAYHVTLAMTNRAGGVDTIDPSERLSLLPSNHQPLLVELGVLQNTHRVLFAVQPGTVLSGPGTCTPGPIDCEILSLGLDQIEGLSAQTKAGIVAVSEFAVTAVKADEYSTAAAADNARRVASAAGRAVLAKSTLPVLSLFQYDPSVGAVVDLRNLTVGGS